MLRFNASHNAQNDSSDALKFYNQDETLGTVNSGMNLSINKTTVPALGDRLVLLTDRFRNTMYTFNVNVDGVLGTQAVLLDTYTGQRTALNSGSNSVDFDVISGDAASNDINRFEILFENSTLSSGDSRLQNELVLFPNPVTNGQFTLQSSLLNGKDVTVNLYNVLGQLIHSQEATFNNSLIIQPQVDLSSGMYLARVSTQDETATLQVIVK